MPIIGACHWHSTDLAWIAADSCLKAEAPLSRPISVLVPFSKWQMTAIRTAWWNFGHLISKNATCYGRQFGTILDFVHHGPPYRACLLRKTEIDKQTNPRFHQAHPQGSIWRKPLIALRRHPSRKAPLKLLSCSLRVREQHSGVDPCSALSSDQRLIASEFSPMAS